MTLRAAAFNGLFILGLIAFELAFYNLIQTGTCASGGPYVIGSECPSGTTGWTLTMLGGIAAMIVGGIGMPVIGDPRHDEDRRPWLPLLAFVPGMKESALFFSLTGAVALLAAAKAESGDGSEATWVGAGFIALGIGGWLVGRWLSHLANSPRKP
jgi:hypothetical protein